MKYKAEGFFFTENFFEHLINELHGIAKCFFYFYFILFYFFFILVFGFNTRIDFIAELYVKDVTSGATANQGKPSILKETAASALVNGNNLLGRMFTISTLLHSERPNFHTILVFLSAIGLNTAPLKAMGRT